MTWRALPAEAVERVLRRDDLEPVCGGLFVCTLPAEVHAARALMDWANNPPGAAESEVAQAAATAERAAARSAATMRDLMDEARVASRAAAAKAGAYIRPLLSST
jgi:hypothetical protein